MADMIAKREARRRRILENSSSRLQKITGRNDCKFSDTIDGAEVDIMDIDKQCDLDNSELNLTYSSYQSSHENMTDNVDSNMLTNRRLNSSLYPNNNDLSNVKQNDVAKSPMLVPDTSLLTNSLLKNRFSYILVAALVNLLLILKLGHVFKETIVVPYLIVAFGRLYTCNGNHDTRNGHLLITALILCNVNPQLIRRFRTTLTYFTIIFRDLALYIFSFVLIHCGLSLLYALVRI